MYVGIDPGLTATGIAVIGYPKSTSTTVKPGGDVEEWQRISDLAADVVVAVGRLTGPPEKKMIVGIEDNHFGMNAQSALKQRELIGAIIAYLCLQPRTMIIKVAPTSAKKALTGSGKADKDQMVAAASKSRFSKGWADRPKYKKEAEADALGVALAAKEKHQADQLEDADA